MYYIPKNGSRNKLSIKADVKRLDCGKEQHVGLNQWLSPKNLTKGCPYYE